MDNRLCDKDCDDKAEAEGNEAFCFIPCTAEDKRKDTQKHHFVDK